MRLEEEEVRRASSINPQAASLAAARYRNSVIAREMGEPEKGDVEHLS
jgi:hypothetical protein